MDNDKIEHFLQLRAQNNSYNKISKTIKVSKPTLIKWSREYALELQNLRAIEKEAISEKYRLTHDFKIKTLKSILDKMINEINKRDFSDVPSSKLAGMILLILEKMNNETNKEIIFKDYENFTDPIGIIKSWSG